MSCLKEPFIFSSLNWGPIFQVWFIIQKRGCAVLTNLKQQPNWISSLCPLHPELAWVSCPLHQAPSSGIQNNTSTTVWTMVVTIAEGANCQSMHSLSECLPDTDTQPFPPSSLTIATPLAEIQGTKRWSILQIGGPARHNVVCCLQCRFSPYIPNDCSCK